MVLGLRKGVAVMFFFLVLSFLLFQTVFALEGDQRVVNISAVVGEPFVFSVNISNFGSYDVHNIKFVGVGVTSDEVTLVPNESRVLNVSYTSSLAGDYAVDVTLEGFKAVSCSELVGGGPELVTITGEGADRGVVEICAGRDVKFLSNYASWIKLKVYPDAGWGARIEPGAYDVRRFDVVGSFPFEVYPLLPGGVVVVKDDSVFVHSVFDDYGFVLDVSSVFEGTVLGVENVPGEVSVVGGEFSGYLVVRNNGVALARNVRLVADWFGFSPNGFDLGVGESRAINFVVSPLIYNELESNKSHVKNLVIGADNADEMRFNVSVFVPFQDIGDSNVTDAGWWDAKNDFCSSNPMSPLCYTPEPIVSGACAGSASDDLLLNLSRKDVQLLFQEVARQSSVAEDAFALMQDYRDEQSFTNERVLVYTNRSAALAEENKDESEALSQVVFVMFFGVAFMLLMIVGLVFFVKWYRQQRKGRVSY